MERVFLSSLALLLVGVFAVPALAGGDTIGRRPSFNRDIVEADLIAGMQSGNFGLRTSSAMTLGELRSSRALSSLLRMLENESDDEGRIVAAFVLFKTDDPVGVRAVMQAPPGQQRPRPENVLAFPARI